MFFVSVRPTSSMEMDNCGQGRLASGGQIDVEFAYGLLVIGVRDVGKTIIIRDEFDPSVRLVQASPDQSFEDSAGQNSKMMVERWFAPPVAMQKTVFFTLRRFDRLGSFVLRFVVFESLPL